MKYDDDDDGFGRYQASAPEVNRQAECNVSDLMTIN